MREEDVKGQLKLTERDREVVGSVPRLIHQPEGNELFDIGEMEVDYEAGGSADLGGCLYVSHRRPTPDGEKARLTLSTSYQMDSHKYCHLLVDQVQDANGVVKISIGTCSGVRPKEYLSLGSKQSSAFVYLWDASSVSLPDSSCTAIFSSHEHS